jgi:lysozyme
MKISSKGLQILKHYEGLRLKSYDDGGGVWTIGYGTTKINGKPVVPGMTCSEEQAESYLKADLAKFEARVDKSVTVELTQSEFDALVVFAYNIGEGAFAASTLVKLLNKGQKCDVPVQLLRWNKDNGKVLAGLTKRRQSEGDLFKLGVVKFY